MVEIIIWLLCGGLCYFIAKQNKRNEYVALVMGILFGVLAVGYYLIAGEPKIKCPYCKERIKQDATICPHCQKELNLIQK